MNDIKAREAKASESSELQARLREQRPMFERIIKEEYDDFVGNRYYL